MIPRRGTSGCACAIPLGTGQLIPGTVPKLRRLPHRCQAKDRVLIDGGTFSTAADVCAVLHHLKRATFVGEETGGGYYGNNSGPMPTVTLPVSKLKLRLPMYEYWNAVPGYAGERRGTLPDYPAPNTVADLLKGVDAPLEVALNLATGTSLPDLQPGLTP